MYIHPSNRYVQPGELAPAWDEATKTRSTDWFFDNCRKRAITEQVNASYYYASISGLRDLAFRAYSKTIAQDQIEIAIIAARGRARLFLIIGDGTPWTDPTNKLTLWEGAPN